MKQHEAELQARLLNERRRCGNNGECVAEEFNGDWKVVYRLTERLAQTKPIPILESLPASPPR